MSDPADVVVLGCGYTGAAVARLARSRGARVLTNVRSAERAEALKRERFEVLRTERLEPEIVAPLVGREAHVVVCFPPDGETDAKLAPALAHAAAITYVSSTGVYGDLRGRIDDETPVPPPASPRMKMQLDAEDAWRNAGATVLRCPGIYGAERGLHHRVVRGEHRIPGDGTRFTSRIHVEDLAALLLAAGKTRGETFVVGDLEPASQADVCAWICSRYGAPFPPSVPIEEVHETLRGDRRINASRALATFGVELSYPTFREGMATMSKG